MARAGAASAISETGLELGVALGIAVLGTIQDVGYRLLLGPAPSSLPQRVAEAAEQSLATLAGAIDPSDPGQAELMVQAREAFTCAMQATAVIAAVAQRRGLPPRAVTIALATAIQESKLRNITYGDRDSVGLFQQRPSQGWGNREQILDPAYAANRFYDALVRIEGYEDMRITEIAQRVQRSAEPKASASTTRAPSDRTTAATTRPPARATARMSVCRPRAAMARRWTARWPRTRKIGRASCRERV